MIRDGKPLPPDIRDRFPAVAAFFQSRQDVRFAYLFGSMARGTDGPLSDVDIAVYIDSDDPETPLDIIGHLNNILQTDEVDLVILNTAPLTLKGKILESREVIADNDPFFRHRFESLTMRMYWDFREVEMRILKAKLRSHDSEAE